MNMIADDDSRDAGRSFLSHSLSLTDLGQGLRRSRGLILLAIVACEILSVLYLIVADPRYPTEMLLAPQQASQGQATSTGSSLGGGLGTVASLLSLNPTSANSDFEKFHVLFTSAQTAAVVDRRFHLLQRSFPGWDEHTLSWKMPPPSVFNAPGRLVRWLFGRPIWRAPTPADLATTLGNQITITKRDDDPFLAVASVSKDPKYTETLMMALTDAANEILRRRAQQQAVEQIRYLNSELQTVANADHRQVLIQLLSGQEQSLMLSRSNLPYAAQILTPPTTHFDQTKPSVTITLALAGLLGLVTGIFLAFIREATARSRDEVPRDFNETIRDWLRR